MMALLAACGSSPTDTQPPAAVVQPNPAPIPTPVPTGPQPSMTGENLDKFPFANRLVLSRIGDNDGRFLVYDQPTVRVDNTGAGLLHFSGSTLDPHWVFVQPPVWPQTVPVGGHLDLALKFIATQDHTLPPQLYSGTLALTSDDPAAPSRMVQLAGLWQPASEIFTRSGRYAEPSLELIRQTFGLGFKLSTPADAAPPTNKDDGSNSPTTSAAPSTPRVRRC